MSSQSKNNSTFSSNTVINLSLPSKPTTSLNQKDLAPPSSSSSSIKAQPILSSSSLPLKPTTSTSIPSDRRERTTIGRRSSRSPVPSYRRRETETYLPPPSPPFQSRRDRYQYHSPSPERGSRRGRDSYRVRSPSPYHSKSVKDTFIPRRSPSRSRSRTRFRSRSISRSPSYRYRSPVRRRPYSPSPPPRYNPPSIIGIRGRSRSFTRSPSPLPYRQRRLRSPSFDRGQRFRPATSPKKYIPENGIHSNRENKHIEDKRLSLKNRLGGFAKQSEVQEKERSSTSSIPNKRPPSPPTTPSDPTPKLLKSIPTGPKGSRLFSSISSGPNIHKALPTGPKSQIPILASTSSAPISESIEQAKQISTDRRSTSPLPELEEDMPGPSRYRSKGGSAPKRGGGGSSNGSITGPSGSTRQLTPPLRDRAQIINQYGSGVTLKSQWLDNPKAPLANFLGNGSGGAHLDQEYRAEEGLIGNKKIFRVTVAGDARSEILGVGDHGSRKEAEKLAALSAVLQLTAAGLLDQGKSGGKSPMSNNGNGTTSSTPISGGSNETANLSDGSTISYDRARQFMEYYCSRYKFGKPDIEFSLTSQTSHKGRKGRTMTNMIWDAVITVGNRRIGMGQSATKKGAQVKAYLDVTQYLESCDPGLWKDFVEASKQDKSANIGLAPHLVFQMSDALNEDIQGLCGDIRNSRLWANAPPSSSVSHNDQTQPLPGWRSGNNYQLSDRELQDKSLELQDRLASYQSNPKLESMRNQRNALPVTSRATEILAKIEVNDVTIVMAATGSGKTTQIPQLLFDDYINRGQGAKCNIVCTQPRRLAAMSVAERIADERGQSLGKEIGYQVRFDVKLPQPNGSITFCTTGIFLKRMQSALGTTADPNAVARMDEVTHIVVDEVHERDIDTDLLLVVLKRLLADRLSRKKPLKVILMSATIDPTLFKTYFADARGRQAPVAEVPGRTFPVERTYLDHIVPQLQGLPSNKGGWVFNEKNVVEYLSKELSRDPANFGPNSGMGLEIPYPLVALTIADVMKRSNDGHVLVFLPGWDEIKKVADILTDSRKPLLGTNFNDMSRYSIHYLHSTIPAAEQKEVFKPPPKGVRRIILATNIAETSITIPDVVYVVDTARVKEKRYDPERHMSSLVSAWVGSSNLNQRAGRAGRHREGEYYGLISKKRLEALEPHQLVEMKRSDLSNVVMHVKALNLGQVEKVLAATIEPPASNRIVAAMETLRMLGALDANQNLTSLGKVLLQLPVEAAIGKLCLYGSFFRCLDSALTLAAVLTNRDPFLAPIALKAEADKIKDSWCPPSFRSDPLAIVSVYNQWNDMDDRGDYRTANQFCSDNFLSKPTMLQIKQVKQSLLQSLDQVGVIAISAGGNSLNSISRGSRYRRLTIPPILNQNGNSLPLLAALIAMANAPNFALRTSDKTCRTSQDKTVFIHASSVNSRRRETGGPEQASVSFNPAEKKLYSFGEKSRNVPLGAKDPNGGITQLRSVTRLDPMTYMLFGAYELVVTQRGLECDNWLPVIGNLHALDDLQRLKVLLDGCMLRVFQCVGKSLIKDRDERWRINGQSHTRDSMNINHNSNNNNNDSHNENDDEVSENESDDEDDDDEKNKDKINIQPLSQDEIKELELLTTDVVRILDAYASERQGTNGTNSVASSRPVTPGFVGHNHGYGNGNSNGKNQSKSTTSTSNYKNDYGNANTSNLTRSGKPKKIEENDYGGW
ncbi:uncharacterized protein L201_001303 [Kwoniella dendrophila CBS 6074]|uniref:Nuclear DNA helicase II n=1 Tax=Kwoniella dendrophila CBS 6074 TaxID=1295534 RepID=A0AAX4JLY2_9TREE